MINIKVDTVADTTSCGTADSAVSEIENRLSFIDEQALMQL